MTKDKLPPQKCDFDQALWTMSALTYFGQCSGPLLLYNDNKQSLVRCEYHARLVEAWIKNYPSAKNRPLFKFLASLNAAAWKIFYDQIKAVSLTDYIQIPTKA